MPRVVSLPSVGRLLVATDFQGNVVDFEAMASLFEARMKEPGGAILVVTGDLVHGPEIPSTNWPAHLGTFYHGDSKKLLARALELQNEYPDRVHYLLGNHEHAHVGGPVVAKFFPDEAERLESLLGDEEREAVREWIRGWPFIAIAESAGLAMLHAAPHAEVSSREELESLPLEQSDSDSQEDLEARMTLLNLLWPRTTSEARAHSFLAALSPELRVAVYGHDVARAGFAIDREPLLCVSTSFGCYDGDKMYLEWDLASPAVSARDVARRGLRLLYPKSDPVHRSPLP